MTFNKLSIIAMAMCIFMVSCSSFNPEKVAQQWDAVQIESETITPSPQSPYIGFTDGKIYGFTGCNQINGGIELQGNCFNAQNIAMTMKHCPDAKYEQNFINALNKAKTIKSTSLGFDLLDASGKSVISFVPHTLDTKALEGQWNLTTFKEKSLDQNDETPFLIFDVKNERLAGFTGCNRLTGSLDEKSLKSGKVDFSGLGMSRKFCHNNVFEADFVEALNKANKISIFNEKLYIYGENETLVFSKKK